MNSLIIGLYGIFLLAVGVNGNYAGLIEETKSDTKPFAVWLVILFVLAFLYQNDYTKGIVKPFIVLALINFALRNYETISSELKSIVY